MINSSAANRTTEWQSTKIAVIIRRLEKLIQQQYGCRFTYRQFSRESTTLKQIKEILKLQPSVQKDKLIYLPIYSNSELIGTAELFPHKRLNQQTLGRIYDIITMTVEPSLDYLHRIELLQEQENQITLREHSQNIIPIDGIRKRRSLTITKDFKPQKTLALSVPCFIESQSYHDITKMALEVHFFSKRYAFLHIDELNQSSKDPEVLKSLGSITLFIPEICKLNEAQRHALVQLIESPLDSHRAQIVIGSTFSYRELLGENLVPVDFLRRVSVAHIKMFKPFVTYQKQGILDFFYKSLTNTKLDDRLI